MIKSHLSCAALSVAVAAVLSLPAAAQTDAAFASALGKLPSGLATAAQLKTAPQAPVQVQGPTAPADVWQKVFEAALRYGKREAIPNTQGFSYLISESFTTPKGRVIKQSVNFLVVPVGNGRLKAVAAELIYMEFMVDPKTKQGSLASSVFATDGSGRLTKAFRRADSVIGTVRTEGTPVPLDLSAPDTKGEFESMLEYWIR